jgi:hypothetical protein
LIDRTLDIIGDRGESVDDYWHKEGLIGERKKLLDAVREGRTSAHEISGSAPVPVYNKMKYGV